MGMRASCSFLSSRDAFKRRGGCASCDLLHYFCCYPCTGSSCVQKSCLQQVSIQTLPVLGVGGLSPTAAITHKGLGTTLALFSTSQGLRDGSPLAQPWVTKAAGHRSGVSSPRAPPAELSILLLILLLGLRGCLAAGDCTVRTLINN